MRLRSTDSVRVSATAAAATSQPSNAKTEFSAAISLLARPPSQKELANVFRVTTRHLRRWEHAEREAGRPCSHPYSTADLWRLYQRRYPKLWDRAEAVRLRLESVFDQFDAMLGRGCDTSPPDENATATTLMLKCLAWDGAETPAGTLGLPHPLRAKFAQAAREQLREILLCGAARETLARAYFEATLLAQTGAISQPSEPIALSA